MKYLHDVSGNITNRSPFAVSVPPQIVGQPVQQIAAPGEIATFSVVVADARGVTFQWKFNGTDILVGGTGDSLLLTKVQELPISNEGLYSVVVTNSAGSVTSAPAALMLDRDGNGLPDSWEKEHFKDPDPTHPLNPANQRSGTDPDQDGVSNLDEFLDGTDPISSASLRPRLIVHSDPGGSVTVTPMKLSYDLGEAVTLTALPFLASGRVRWAGDLDGTGNPASVKMDGHKTVRARFASPAPLPPGLIALWRGDANASDLIGGHHGTFYVGTTVAVASITSAGKVGGAFDFDGTVHVQVPDSAELNPAQLTVELWVFPKAQSVDFAPIAARGSSSDDVILGDYDTWYLGLHDSKPQFASHGNKILDCPFAIPLNEWTHLAITFDGSFVRAYVDGAQVASRDEVGPVIYDAVPVTIGCDWSFNHSAYLFKGRIDEVALYNRALTPDEVLGIYNADFSGKDFLRPYFTSTAVLPDAIPGSNYMHQLTTFLGTPPISFSLSGGVLPPGMTLSVGGVISGVSSLTGVFEFTVRATDSGGLFTEQLCELRTL